MKKIFLLILSILTLSACSNSFHYGAVSTKPFNLNSTSLIKGKNVSYDYKINLFEKREANSINGTAESVIKESLSKNKCAVAFNNANIHKTSKFSSIEIQFKGEEIIDQSIPGCK